jgi:AAA domain
MKAISLAEVEKILAREGLRLANGDEIEAPRADTFTVLAADVHPESVTWLWQDRIPLGMPTVLGGFPGVGKSTVLYDLAARTSREGKRVLVVTAEDHLAAVVRPRLEAAGADLGLVHIVVVPVTLPEDVALLDILVREHDVALLILDPLVAFIGDQVNTHRDHHVRRVLAPLADLAEQTGAAVVVVVHTNKGSGTEPLMRISGSIGFTGAARSVLLAADDPQDETRRILAVIKSNLAQHPPPLAYRLVGVELDEGITTSRVDWLGEAPEVDVRELLVGRDPEERSDREEAIEFLREAGVLTVAQLARELEAEAKSLGIGEKTLQRARRALRVPAWKSEFQGPTYWGPRPGSKVDTQSGLPTPVQTVQIGTDLRGQAPGNPNLDSVEGLGRADA